MQAPTNLLATAGNQQVALAWTPPANGGLVNYYVYRANTRIAQTASPRYTDSGLVNGTTYKYYVVAVTASGATSHPSNVVWGTAEATAAGGSVSAPALSSAPTISGSAVSGDSLTASSGSWHNSPSAYSYQWERCDRSGGSCTAVSGANSSSYQAASGDVGDTLAVAVTASNAAGSSTAVSAPTAVVQDPPPAASAGPAGTGAPASNASGSSTSTSSTTAVGAGPSTGSCTATVSTVAQVNAALAPSAVVCLTTGSYGALTITASPSSRAVLTAAPSSHVVVAGIDIRGSNLTVTQLHSTGGITINNGGSNDVVDHDEVTNAACGYGVSVFGVWSGSTWSSVAGNDVISNNLIHDTGTTCEADAMRAQGFANLTVTGNDVYNIVNSETACGGECHTDTFQVYQAGVPTSGLTVTRNYVHDTTGAQGLPFLKDGDVANVTISDNLATRMGSPGGEISGMTLAENTQGAIVTDNTYLGTAGSLAEAYGTSPNPSLVLSHNVFDQFNVQSNTSPYVYAVSESYNTFTANNEWSFSLSPSDTYTTNVTFRCGSSCGNGTVAGDDYRLANNPNGEGIDWAPSSQSYGPGY